MELKAIPSQSASVILANLPTRVDLLSGLKTILSALKSHASSLTLPQQSHSPFNRQVCRMTVLYRARPSSTSISCTHIFLSWAQAPPSPHRPISGSVSCTSQDFKTLYFFSPAFQTVETKKKKPWVLTTEDSSRRQLLFKHLTTLKICHHFQILILFI